MLSIARNFFRPAPPMASMEAHAEAYERILALDKRVCEMDKRVSGLKERTATCQSHGVRHFRVVQPVRIATQWENRVFSGIV